MVSSTILYHLVRFAKCIVISFFPFSLILVLKYFQYICFRPSSLITAWSNVITSVLSDLKWSKLVIL